MESGRVSRLGGEMRDARAASECERCEQEQRESELHSQGKASVDGMRCDAASADGEGTCKLGSRIDA